MGTLLSWQTHPPLAWNNLDTHLVCIQSYSTKYLHFLLRVLSRIGFQTSDGLQVGYQIFVRILFSIVESTALKLRDEMVRALFRN
jgi:hypothetical protein